MGAKCWSISSSVETITGRKAKSWATLRIRNAVKKKGADGRWPAWPHTQIPKHTWAIKLSNCIIVSLAFYYAHGWPK